METQVQSSVLEKMVDDVLILQLNAAHHHNPISAEMEKAMAKCLKEANENDEVRAVIITGGRERSFSVGGDFNEVKHFTGGREVDEWINDIIEMYVACLEVEKPTIAALDNFVIGIGFQLALCCDYRIASSRSQLIMPELKNGIACVLGQYMLEKMLGRAAMQEIVFDCEAMPLADCLQLKLLNKVVEPEDLARQTMSMAKRLAAYPEVAYRLTKREINLDFAKGLRKIVPVAQSVHRAAFKDKSAQRFMNKILTK
jgi:carboxymethylproline synthase